MLKRSDTVINVTPEYPPFKSDPCHPFQLMGKLTARCYLSIYISTQIIINIKRQLISRHITHNTIQVQIEPLIKFTAK